jgi:formylglycine-generating enzyme required for sulfatase activity
MYPDGAAVCGAEDMSGQVYEWCQNEHYDPKIISVNDSLNRRALRGGAYFRSAPYVACAKRGQDNPFLEGTRVGFRLVVSFPIQ